MKDKLFILFQYLLPKKYLSIVLGWLASKKLGKLTHKFIEWFVSKYQVNLKEAKEENIKNYDTFNEFFSRKLKKNARNIADSDFVSPVDGMISQLGAIEEQSIFQAKGKKYSLQSLLANDEEYLNYFIDGQFATLYLSPKDYHRIHMPYGATLMKMVHVPGKLFSVNPTTVAHVSNIFAKNERVICYFKAPDIGVFAVILVGATVVGSIKTAWHGVVNKKRPKNIRYWYYEHQPVHLFKAEEMGQFLLGSTVILLFEKKSIQFVEQWQAKTLIKMGEAMGNKI